ncbi:MAG: hypothetical protein J7494_05700 [Sphingobium sp.]|nr:hypothetical protein [Sphingobium sp.]
MTRISRTMMTILAGVSLPMLAGCGANEIASPGQGAVTINIGNGTPTPSPTPTPAGTLVTPASGCPTISNPVALTDSGTISGPTGEYRVCTLPAIFSRNTTLPKIAGVLYRLNGRVDVGCDGGFSAPTSGAPFASPTVGCTAANGFTLNGSNQLTADSNVTLTIEPGVILYGGTGASWLAVNRGNKISAVGSATAPIIFTSRDNVLGQETATTIGHWGGVVLLGRGRVTDCRYGSVGTDTCERETEGATESAVFGGRDNTYNAGRMSFVQIRYSGFILSATFELQSLTGEGIGTGTVLDHIQSHNSSDDGSEFFGGALQMKYYVSTGADDDSLDLDTGVQAAVQYALMVQRDGQGDALMEFDSNGNESDTPRSTMKIANFTGIQPSASANNNGSSGDQASVLLRGNSDTTWVNGIIATPNNECLRMNASGTTPATLVAKSVAMQCNSTKYLGSGNYTAAQVATAFGAGANNNSDTYAATLTGFFINGTAETAIAATDPKTVDAFFDTTNYIGAVKDANETWQKGWTCNSTYVTFDDAANSKRSCTSLPS